MIKQFATDMKIDSEPIFRESKGGDYCYFQLSSASPINGVFYKYSVQAFDDFPAKIKKFAEFRESITGEKGCKGIIVETVLTVSPFSIEGNVVAGYKILDIAMCDEYKRNLKKFQSNKQKKEQKEEKDIMDMAKMLNTNPFGLN